MFKSSLFKYMSQDVRPNYTMIQYFCIFNKKCNVYVLNFINSIKYFSSRIKNLMFYTTLYN